MSDEMSLLEAIMVEEDDLDLFPGPVLDAWKEPSRRGEARDLLRKAMAKETNARRKELRQKYVDELRLWMTPITKAPGLGTLNGFGTRLYGSYQRRPDGTAIGTQWVTALYLPVLPLGAYLYEDVGGNEYSFFGRTPLPPRSFIAPAVWGALTVGLFGFGTVSTMQDAQYVDVHVFNGYQEPVVVVAGETETTIPGRYGETLAVGIDVAQLVATTEDGQPLDTVTVDLSDHGGGEAVFNVAGRGVVGSGWATYGATTERPYDVLGERFVFLDHDIQYAFTPPPDEIKTSGSGGVRSVLEALDDPNEPGRAMAGLMQNDRPEAALRLGLAAFGEAPGKPLDYQVFAAVMSRGDLRAACDQATEALPLDVQVHRVCQDYGRLEGWEGIQARYEALVDVNPDSAAHRYLLGRLLDDETRALSLFREASALDPTSPWPEVALAYHEQVIAMDAEKALAHYERLRELDGPLFAERASDWVRAHRVLGRAVDHEILKEADAGVFSTADMLALEADPSKLPSVLQRLEADVGPEDSYLANLQANAALIAGDVARLSAFNDEGAGLELWEALSDGGDLERSPDLPPEALADLPVAVLDFTVRSLRGQPTDAPIAEIRAVEPQLAEALTAGNYTEEGLQAALVDVAPGTHGSVWFAAYRLTGDESFGRRAKAWGLPQELPYFAL